MQCVTGHIAWSTLLRREGLCLLDECYAFTQKYLDSSSQRTLWPRVRQELWRVRCLLPLCRVDWRAQWSSDLHCSDASPFGLA
eukprot:1522500-Pyramimonas_sp.AAC.1